MSWALRKLSIELTNNKHGYRGIYFDAAKQKWRAEMYIGSGKKKRLGTFNTKEDAAQAYDNAVSEIYGIDAAANFPIAGQKKIQVVGRPGSGFCSRGHDLAVVGFNTTGNYCKACNNEASRRCKLKARSERE